VTGEHWLDRLAVASTRRQAFKLTLAGAALAAVPFLRPGRAQAAEDAHACQKGCLYTSHREYRADYLRCTSGPLYQSLAETMLMGTGMIGFTKVLVITDRALYCIEHALLVQKRRAGDCFDPGCPGFDPESEWGPCRNCATITGCQCCPDASAPTGYTYCSRLSDYCCNPNGGCKPCGT